MTTLLDLLFVASFAVAFPLFDYLVSWPAFHRRSRGDPARARMSLWKQTIVGGWGPRRGNHGVARPARWLAGGFRSA